MTKRTILIIILIIAVLLVLGVSFDVLGSEINDTEEVFLDFEYNFNQETLTSTFDASNEIANKLRLGLNPSFLLETTVDYDFSPLGLRPTALRPSMYIEKQLDITYIRLTGYGTFYLNDTNFYGDDTMGFLLNVRYEL